MQFACWVVRRKGLSAEAARYFDAETGVLQAPMIVTVADQVWHRLEGSS